MPIYEYECTRCSSRFELKQSFSENTPASCPRCGGKARRIFRPVPIIFKGSGFYSTDHRDNHGHSAPAGSTDEAKASHIDKAKTNRAEEAKTSSKKKK